MYVSDSYSIALCSSIYAFLLLYGCLKSIQIDAGNGTQALKRPTLHHSYVISIGILSHTFFTKIIAVRDLLM